MKHRTGLTFITVVTLLATTLMLYHGSIWASGELPADRLFTDNGQVTIKRIAPERVGGHAYQLVYHVNVPISAFWKFKTDFDNTFLVENKFIRGHRFISRIGNIAITENQYTYQPDIFFRWQTTLFPKRFRLEFILLNPQACSQKYHHGYIQLEPEGQATRVTQVAYFDFWGATFWTYNPWSGGMRDFLTYTARWEQKTALRLKNRYQDKNDIRQ